jgi:hypothetical protein
VIISFLNLQSERRKSVLDLNKKFVFFFNFSTSEKFVDKIWKMNW